MGQSSYAHRTLPCSACRLVRITELEGSKNSKERSVPYVTLLMSALLAQTAPPKVSDEFTPPPVAHSVRNATKCISGEEIISEVFWRRGAVTVGKLSAFNHNISARERRDINARLKSIGYFSYVDSFCNGPRSAGIVIHGMDISNGFSKDVTITWWSNGYSIS